MKLYTSDHGVFFSYGKFFDHCHHLIHRFVGERTACIPGEVFSKLFFAAFEQLYDRVFAFEFCCFGIIFPAGEEVRPFFTRPCRRYGWSPHFPDLSCCCLCSGFTRGLQVCAVRMDCKKYSGKFVLYIFCFVLAFRVQASVFWHSVFFLRQPFSVVGFGRDAKTKMAVEARRSILLFFVRFSAKEDSCSGFFAVMFSHLFIYLVYFMRTL